MTSLLAPTTPKRTPCERSVLQRSFTVPANITPGLNRINPSGTNTPHGVETLFSHPSARIVSFKTSIKSASSTPDSTPASNPRPAVNDLPWRNGNERTIAAGHLEIYRVQGSVSFLHSGSLLHAILPRSQCWCVDGVSKFVFRVLPGTYYRIELPCETEDDKALVKSIIATFKLVLFYERTPCPFIRGFHENDDTASNLDPTFLERKGLERPTEPAKKWKLDGVWRPEDQLWAKRLEMRTGRSYTKAEKQRSETTVQSDGAHVFGTDLQKGDESNTRRPHQGTHRSVTAPPAWMIAAPSASMVPEDHDPYSVNAHQHSKDERDGLSAGDYGKSSLDRTCSTSKGTTGSREEADGLDPVTMDSDEISDHISNASPEQKQARSHAAPSATTVLSSPPLFSGAFDDGFWPRTVPSSPSSQRIRRRRGDSVSSSPPRVRRTPEGRSSAVGYYSPETNPSLPPEDFADKLLTKSYAMFSGPSANLVATMLKIAARIATEALSMTVQTPHGARRHVPGSWDQSDDEDGWDFDDFGFPLRPDTDLY